MKRFERDVFDELVNDIKEMKEQLEKTSKMVHLVSAAKATLNEKVDEKLIKKFKKENKIFNEVLNYYEVCLNNTEITSEEEFNLLNECKKILKISGTIIIEDRNAMIG